MHVASSRAVGFSLSSRERVFRKAAVLGCVEVHRKQRLVTLEHIEREMLETTEQIESNELKVSARAEARSLENAGQSVGAATKRVHHSTIPVASSPTVAATLGERATSLCSAEPHGVCVVGYSAVGQYRAGAVQASAA